MRQPHRASQAFCSSLFRVGKQGEEAVEVAFDAEIKSPPPVDPGLPDIAGLIVFFGMKGRVAEILNQEGDAAVNCPLDSWGSARVVLEEALGVEGPHVTAFSIS